MKWAAGLLALAAVVAAGGLDGTITGGKAKRLVDRASPLLAKGDAAYKAWVLEELAADAVVAELKAAVAAYDDAIALLQEALDLQYDAGVNHRVRVTASRLQKMRFRLAFVRPEPKPRPEAPDAPAPPPPPPPAPPEHDDDPPPAATFRDAEPPATPVDAQLPVLALADDAKKDAAAIQRALREYYTGRRRKKLRMEHRLCRGEGAFRDGTPCTECSGSGVQINQHLFKKAFWNCYTPSLRDAPGALDALKAFYEHAKKHPDVLGAAVTSFRVKDIEHHGYWARVRVEERFKRTPTQRTFTMIGVGRNWYFYHPTADRSLVPGEEGE